MVSALVSGSTGLGSSPDREHCICVFRVSNFPGGRPPHPLWEGAIPPPIPSPPPRQRCVEGAQALRYIALTATQFHSPSTSNFAENPVSCALA